MSTEQPQPEAAAVEYPAEFLQAVEVIKQYLPFSLHLIGGCHRLLTTEEELMHHLPIVFANWQREQQQATMTLMPPPQINRPATMTATNGSAASMPPPATAGDHRRMSTREPAGGGIIETQTLESVGSDDFPVLVRWCGLVKSIARDTANAFNTAVNNCINGIDKAMHGPILLGWLDKENRANVHNAVVAYKLLNPEASAAPAGDAGGAAQNFLVDGEDVDAGVRTEGFHNRTGLEQVDSREFTIPLEQALNTLQEIIPGELGRWPNQLKSGVLKPFWSSLFDSQHMYKTLISWGVVQKWVGPNVRPGKLRLEFPVPRPDNVCALQYFAIKAFMEMINCEPEMLQLPPQHYDVVVDRCRARMGALMHEYTLQNPNVALEFDPELPLNLPKLEPLVGNLIPAPADIGEGEAEEIVATQAEVGVVMGEATGITPDMHGITLSGGAGVVVAAADDKRASPSKRSNETRDDNVIPVGKRRGRPRKQR